MLARPELRKSACPHDCPSACSLEIMVLPDNRIGRVSEVPDTPATRGMIAKVRHLIRLIDER